MEPVLCKPSRLAGGWQCEAQYSGALSNDTHAFDRSRSTDIGVAADLLGILRRENALKRASELETAHAQVAVGKAVVDTAARLVFVARCPCNDQRRVVLETRMRLTESLR